MRARYARDPLLFIEHWAVTYDPRVSPPQMPFVPFERQRDLVRWIMRRLNAGKAGEEGAIEKARDTGVTWICVYVATCLWLFRPGFKCGFGSRKELLVDNLGESDSIFEKVRIQLRDTPAVFMPRGFDVEEDANYLKIVNPATGATLTGEAGDNIGRGGRNTMYFVDESAFMQRPRKIEAALSRNTDCRIHLSTVNPGAAGGPFHQKCKKWRGTDRLFEFDWRDDPRKDEAWYELQKRDLEAFTVASEIDRNWEADVANIICPGAWVRAARDWKLKAKGPRVAGMDVGAGGDLSVVVIRQGPVIEIPYSWNDPDVINTAEYARDLCVKQRVSVLNYDWFGVGSGVAAALKRLPGVKAHGIMVGDPGSGRRWEDGLTSKEKFLNLKAELWWSMRERLQKTYQHVAWLASDGHEGRQYPEDELICLPDSDVLCEQLSTVRYHRTPNGKIQVETKEQLQKRGVKSPDHADAAVLTFAPGAGEIRVRTVKGMY